MGIKSPIFNVFGRSPIRPLQQHIEKAHQAVEQLREFFKAVQNNDWQKATDIHQIILTIEKDADSIKKDLRLHLPKGLFLPVPRGDILGILHMQDELANLAQDIAGLVIGRKLHIPDEFFHDYQLFLDRCIEASMQARKAINELDELLETSFRGNEVKILENMVNELDQIENSSDEMQIKIRQRLFSIEKDLQPVNVMFLYKIIELTGDLADAAQSIGGRLLLLVAT